MMGERDLVCLAQQGDTQAFCVLMEKYEKQIYRRALRVSGNVEDARDLTQEVFLRVYLRLNSYKGDAPFGKWIHRVATNLWIDRSRKKKIPIVPWPEWEDGEEARSAEFPSATPGPERVLEERESLEEIASAVRRLPQRYREAFVMKNLQDRRYEEIAEALDCPAGTVKSRVFRANGLLKMYLASGSARNTGHPRPNKLGREMAAHCSPAD